MGYHIFLAMVLRARAPSERAELRYNFAKPGVVNVLPSSCYFHIYCMRGALGYIRNRKNEKKSSKTVKPQKNSAETENHIQNRQKPIQWCQVGHTEQTTLALISAKYL